MTFNTVLQTDVSYEVSSPSPKSAVISVLLSSVHTATWFGHHKYVVASVLEKTNDRNLQYCRCGVMLAGWIPCRTPDTLLLEHLVVDLFFIGKLQLKQKAFVGMCDLQQNFLVRKDFSHSGETS